MARRLVIANQKGGVGKSTTALNLGAALAEMGYRVLLVDLDAQGALSASLGVDIYQVRRTAYSLLSNSRVSLARVIHHMGGTVGLVPASIDLAHAEVVLSAVPDAPFLLRDALDRSLIPFDYILMDTPPSLGTLTAIGLVAADELLIPVQCQYLAMRGVRALLDVVDRVRYNLHPGLKLLGLLGTMYRPESVHAREVVDEMRAVFPQKTLRTLIHDDDIYAESPVAAQSVLTYAPSHPAAQAYRALAEEIVYERRPT